MPNLKDYYRDLLEWEGIPFCELVHLWPPDLQDEIEAALETAIRVSCIKGSECPIKANTKNGSGVISNQSVGNQVEKYAAEKLSKTIQDFIISPCKGGGYPDRELVRNSSNTRMPLEVKATSEWNPSDSNRRVLTSSSTKLRTEFSGPIYHLLMTVLHTPFSQGADSVRVNAIRLDFIEPATEVNVRLEASVSHKILADGPHRNKVI